MIRTTEDQRRASPVFMKDRNMREQGRLMEHLGIEKVTEALDGWSTRLKPNWQRFLVVSPSESDMAPSLRFYPDSSSDDNAKVTFNTGASGAEVVMNMVAGLREKIHTAPGTIAVNGEGGILTVKEDGEVGFTFPAIRDKALPVDLWGLKNNQALADDWRISHMAHALGAQAVWDVASQSFILTLGSVENSEYGAKKPNPAQLQIVPGNEGDDASLVYALADKKGKIIVNNINPGETSFTISPDEVNVSTQNEHGITYGTFRRDGSVAVAMIPKSGDPGKLIRFPGTK